MKVIVSYYFGSPNSISEIRLHTKDNFDRARFDENESGGGLLAEVVGVHELEPIHFRHLVFHLNGAKFSNWVQELHQENTTEEDWKAFGRAFLEDVAFNEWSSRTSEYIYMVHQYIADRILEIETADMPF